MSNRPFDFTQEPGKELKIEKYDNNDEILVTVITPFYNSKKYIRYVITLPDDVLYKNGKGTENSPYTIYLY